MGECVCVRGSGILCVGNACADSTIQKLTEKLTRLLFFLQTFYMALDTKPSGRSQRCYGTIFFFNLRIPYLLNKALERYFPGDDDSSLLCVVKESRESYLVSLHL